LNIAYPTNGTQKMFEIDRKQSIKLYDKKIGDQFDGGVIGPEFEGAIVEITGGDDNQGFPMVKDHLTKNRLRLLLSKGDVGYRCRRKGTRKRKSVRGSIVSEETCVLNLIIIQAGEKEIDGLTNVVCDVTHLPRRVDKLRKLFNVPKTEENVSKYIMNMLRAECGGDIKKVPQIRSNEKILKRKKEKIQEGARIRAERRKILEEERAAYLKKYFNKA